MLLRSCDSWTNTCLTAWEQRGEVAAVEVRSAPLTLSLSPAAAPAWRESSADGVGGAASARTSATGHGRRLEVALRSPRGRRQPSGRTRGAVRGAVHSDADFKPFFAMI